VWKRETLTLTVAALNKAKKKKGGGGSEKNDKDEIIE
jgi:hypothetical protein